MLATLVVVVISIAGALTIALAIQARVTAPRIMPLREPRFASHPHGRRRPGVIEHQRLLAYRRRRQMRRRVALRADAAF